MTIAKRDFERVAASLSYVAQDPTADHDTVIKMVQEFCNAASALNPRFKREVFVGAVFGPDRRAVLNIYTGKGVECGACGYDLFYDRGRSLDYYHHECGKCGHKFDTLTESGASR